MRKKILLPILLVVAAVIAVSACSRNAEGQKPTPAMLSDALPTITDMPGNWSESQRQVFTVRGAENPSIDPSVWCPQASQVTKNLITLAGKSGADVEMELTGSTNVRRMMRLQAWSNDEVVAWFRDAKEAVHICDGKTFTDASGVASTPSIIEGRDIGDESISWSQVVEPPAGAGAAKMVSVGRTTIARFGDIIMVLQLGDAVTGTRTNPFTEDAWWDIVEMAGKKLHDLDKQVHD